MGQPIQVNATEHFCEGVKRWSCSAAIVRDRQDGSVIGAIDITGMVSEFHLHSLALVISVANHVETILARQAADRRSALIQWSHDHVDRGSGEVIVLDRRGYLVSAPENLGSSQPDRRKQISRLVASARSWLTDAGRAAEPDRLDPQWFRPVTVDDETIGAVIVLPGRAVSRLPLQDVEPRQGLRSALPSPAKGFGRIVRKCPEMEVLVRRADKLSMSSIPLLIEGETGSGKEELAKAIHERSPFSSGPYVQVDCATLAHAGDAIVEFQGAAGIFEQAEGGTLVLDEIGELPADMQGRLLRLLQDSQTIPLDADGGRQARIRILATTSRNLLADRRAGRFRDDLYYRISVAGLRIPPLRDRREDIAPLAGRFLHQLGRQYGRHTGELTLCALEILQMHYWPGNVRELRNMLERAFLVAEGSAISGEDIAAAMGDGMQALSAAAPAAVVTLRDIEEASIRSALDQCNGKVLRAARHLGISRSTLYEKLRKYGIKRH
jgi:transcriptional regulator of acetoin/glycerol metabolism